MTVWELQHVTFSVSVLSIWAGLTRSLSSSQDSFLVSPFTEKSCLLVCRSNKGPEVPLSPSLNQHNISQMVFHKIRKEDLEFVSLIQMSSILIMKFKVLNMYGFTVKPANNILPSVFRWRVWVRGHLPKSSKGSVRSWETMDSCTKQKLSWKSWTRHTGITLRCEALKQCKMFCFLQLKRKK